MIRLILFFSLLFGAGDEFIEYRYTLKKDEYAKIEVVNEEISKSYIFKFRWTLFDGNKIVVLVNFKGFPYHYILENSYKRNSFRFVVGRSKFRRWDKAEIRVVFKEFKDNKATFLVYVLDKVDRISINFL